MKSIASVNQIKKFFALKNKFYPKVKPLKSTLSIYSTPTLD